MVKEEERLAMAGGISPVRLALEMTRVERDLKERMWVGKVVARLMDSILSSETWPEGEHLMKDQLQGAWSLGFQEEKRGEEEEELKVESHESNDRASWLRLAETGGRGSAARRKKRMRLMDIAGMDVGWHSSFPLVP